MQLALSGKTLLPKHLFVKQNSQVKCAVIFKIILQLLFNLKNAFRPGNKFSMGLRFHSLTEVV